jgi:hypothetical protein
VGSELTAHERCYVELTPAAAGEYAVFVDADGALSSSDRGSASVEAVVGDRRILARLFAFFSATGPAASSDPPGIQQPTARTVGQKGARPPVSLGLRSTRRRVDYIAWRSAMASTTRPVPATIMRTSFAIRT